MSERMQWAVIGRGFNGWHAESDMSPPIAVPSGDATYRQRVSSSGGDLYDTPWPYGGVKRGYLQDAAPGCIVYDASHLTGDAESAFIHAVCVGTTERAAYLARLRAVPGIKWGSVVNGEIVWE